MNEIVCGRCDKEIKKCKKCGHKFVGDLFFEDCWCFSDKHFCSTDCLFDYENIKKVTSIKRQKKN